MKQPESSPKQAGRRSPDIDSWLRPKILRTADSTELRFAALQQRLLAESPPRVEAALSAMPWASGWRNAALALGGMAASLTAVFFGLRYAQFDGPEVLAARPVPATLQNLFEWDESLAPAIALLDADLRSALLYLNLPDQDE